MNFNLDMIILFVHNIDKLKVFYTDAFHFEIVEEIKSEWVLFRSGSCKIGLHKIGASYKKENFKITEIESNKKIIFEIDEDITKARNWLTSNGAIMKEIKTFTDGGQLFCDGEDPERKIFQLMQR